MDELARWLSHPRHCVLQRDAPDYPALLRHCPDPPRRLHVDGDAGLLWHPAIAIVGSRAASPNGRDTAHAFARALARGGWCIASGMASGIDSAAHEGALSVEGGRTVAVLGTGVDVAYPARNATLMARIAERGAVVSEYPPGAGPLAWRFPQRNRIVAGLALGTLVVEARAQSGALITARLAAEAGREVFAIPGSIHEPRVRGCHQLIRDGAQLVESPEEIVASLNPLLRACADDLRDRLHVPTSPSAASQHAGATGDDDTQCLWNALGHDPIPMDVLALRTGLTTAKLVSILLVMELEGRVVSEHGRYTRKSS